MSRSSSGSRSCISSIDPLMSANSALTVLRSPSIAGNSPCCSEVILTVGAADLTCDELGAVALVASALPQSSQNSDAGAFSAPQLAHRLPSGFPHVAQNFLPLLL